MPDKVQRCKDCRRVIRFRYYKGKIRPFGCECKEECKGGSWYDRYYVSHPSPPNVNDSEFWIKSFLIPRNKTSNPIIICMDKKKIELKMELTEPSTAKYDIKKVKDQIFTIEYESDRNCILTAPFGETNLTFKAKIYPTQGSLIDD